MKNYNLNPREKFESGPGFEPRTSRSLAWRSTTNYTTNLLFMESWVTSKKALSGAPSSSPGSYLIATCPERNVSHVCQLMIRVIMRRIRGLCTDLMAFALRMRKAPENLS